MIAESAIYGNSKWIKKKMITNQSCMEAQNKMRAPKTPRQTAEEAKLLQEIWYGSTPKKKTRSMKINPSMPEISNPQDVETFSEIVKCLRRDAKNEKKAGLDKPIARLQKDECDLVAGIYLNIANRIEGASVRQQYEICHVISRLLSDSWLLRQSDERNGKPYKLFGEPLTVAYGRFACQLYCAANIQRKFWLAYLKETHSDPKGIDKHLRRCFRDRRCSR